MNTKGLILVFTGDGKGKTTAAMGTALRMISHGKRVGMVLFFKKGARESFLGTRFKTWGFGGGFTWETTREENAKAVQKAWGKCRELLRDPKCNLVILDEIHIALKYEFLKTAEVIKVLKKRPAAQHVILTGRGAPRGLLKAADLVTEMKCLKHPFKRGILAQPGIEF
ncbi:MAG: cob(I)yrinic acid a,c-diamide adenosyltransferase [Candidatus Omnitrophota bacterium]